MQNIPKPQIKNCVALFNCGNRLDLNKINVIIPYSTKFLKNKINAVVMKMHNPNATALLFSSGKIVCTGASTVTDAYQAAQNIIGRLKQYGYYGAEVKDFNIKNMVATVDNNFHIKLGPLFDEYYKICSFEPELFPGLVYRMKNPKVSLIIFNSGKMNITGAKSIEEIEEAFKIIYPILYEYRY